MAFTRNLRLRLPDDLTADARFNLERIDQLGSVFPISASATQSINSASDIRLNANATTLGGNGQGTVYAPFLRLSQDLILESGAFTLTLTPPSLSANITLTLPEDVGTAGQFLSTDGAGVLSWADPPTSNLASLNDTSISNPATNNVLQYDGSAWVNASIPSALQSGVFTWVPGDGAAKQIDHTYGSTSIQVWIYEPESNSSVVVEGIDYINNDTIILTAHRAPDSDYIVHLQQTA